LQGLIGHTIEKKNMHPDPHMIQSFYPFPPPFHRPIVFSKHLDGV